MGFPYTLNSENRRRYPRLKASISQVGREPLDAFRRVFGVGRVTGPYGPYAANKKAHFQFNASGEEARQIIEKLLPYLFHKGEQAEAALAKYKEYNDGRA